MSANSKLFQKPPSQYLDRQEQPYFKAIYIDPNIDFTSKVTRAALDEQASLINELTLTCKDAEYMLKFVAMGDTVAFYGGDLEKSGSINYRKVFQGKIVRIKSDYQENGKVYVVLTCHQVNTLSTSLEVKSYSYPDVSAYARGFIIPYLIQNNEGWEYVATNQDAYLDKLNESKQAQIKRALEVADELYGAQDKSAVLDGLSEEEINAISPRTKIEPKIKSPIAPRGLTSPGDPSLEGLRGQEYAEKVFGFLGSRITMTYTAIVKGIADENGWYYDEDTIRIDPSLESEQDKLPNLLNPVTQDSQSDWKFLIKLSRVLSCRCWLEAKGNELYLYFMDTALIKNPDSIQISATTGVRVEDRDITFFFPRRGYDLYVGGSLAYRPDSLGTKLFGNQFSRKSDIYKYKDFTNDGVIQLKNVTVIEDIGMLNAINPMSSNSVGEDQGIEYRTIVERDAVFIAVTKENARSVLSNPAVTEVEFEGGKQYARLPDEFIIEIDGKLRGFSNFAGGTYFLDGSGTVNEPDYILRRRNYKVVPNREKTVNLSSEMFSLLTEKLANGEDIKDGIFREYITYIPLPLEKEVRKEPFQWRGVRISATIDGNINVRSQRFYDLVGIIRYGSDVDAEPFYLRSLVHTWDLDGFDTKLEFFK